MKFLSHTEDTPSIHYTGIIHRGRCVLGVEIRLYPRPDRVFAILIWDRWIGFAYPPAK